MCGLIGAFRTTKANWDPKIANFMYQGLVLSSFRGMQGTGVGLVMDDGEVSLDKCHNSAAEFLHSQMWEYVKDNLANATAILGHTRYPTAGTVATKNSQPFSFAADDGKRQVMMIHNGHIQDHWSLTNKFKETFTHQVDSAHLCKALACSEPEELLPKVRGNYALVFYDNVKRRIYTANNGGRELYFAAAKDKKHVYFASEDLTLQYLLDRCGLDYKEVLEVPKMQLFGFDLDAETLDPSVHIKYKEEKPKWVAQAPGYTYPAKGESWSKKGTVLWVKMEENTVFTPYPDLKDGTKAEYGHFMATSNADIGSLVHVNGVKATEWATDLQLLRKHAPGGTFPIYVDSCEEEDGPGGKKYNKYEVRLHPTMYKAEVARVTREQSGRGNEPSPWVAGPGTVKVTRAAWQSTADEGCYHCEGPILGSDVGKVGFQLIKTNLSGEDMYQMVCPPCVKLIEEGKEPGQPKAKHGYHPNIDKAL